MGRFLLLAGAVLASSVALILFLKWKIQTMAELYRLPSGQLPSAGGVLMFCCRCRYWPPPSSRWHAANLVHSLAMPPDTACS